MLKKFDIDYDINHNEFEIILNVCGYRKVDYARYCGKSVWWYWHTFQNHPVTYRNVDNLIAMVGGPDKYLKALRRAKKAIEIRYTPRPLAPMPDPPKRKKPEQEISGTGKTDKKMDAVTIVTQQKEKISVPSDEQAENNSTRGIPPIRPDESGKTEPKKKPVRKNKKRKAKKAIPAEKPAAVKKEKVNLSDKNAPLEQTKPLFSEIGISKDELF